MRLTISISAVLAAAMCVFVSGCGKDTAGKAAEEASAKINQAINVVRDYNSDCSGTDYSTALEYVEQARVAAAKAEGRADEVNMLAAELYEGYASRMAVELEGMTLDTRKVVESCGKKLSEICARASLLDTVKMLSKAGAGEQQQLEKLLKDEEGIEAGIKEQSEVVERLTSQIDMYNASIDGLRATVEQLKRKSTQLLNDSALLSGDARSSLEDKAFALIKGEEGGKSRFELENDIQKILDKLPPLEQAKDEAQKLLAQLSADAEFVEARIEALKNGDSTLGYTEQIASLSAQIENGTAELKDATGRLSESVTAFEEKQAQIAELYGKAQASYGKVSKGLKDAALVKMSNLGTRLTELNRQKYDFYRFASDSINKLSELEGEGMPEVLKDMAGPLSEKVEVARTELLKSYEDSFRSFKESLEAATSSSSRDTIARGCMALIYKRLKLSELEGAPADKDALIVMLNDIKMHSIENDPQFAFSYLASLFAQYGVDFKTAQQKLLEEYLSMKIEFADAANLPDETRRTELLALMDKFTSLEPLDDTEAYSQVVKFIFDSAKEDWLAISEDPINQSRLEPLAVLIDEATAAVYEEPLAPVGMPGGFGTDPNA
ncbi:MAG: hypothetical protein AB7F23_07010 [Phycisphaerae bacterium]